MKTLYYLLFTFILIYSIYAAPDIQNQKYGELNRQKRGLFIAVFTSMTSTYVNRTLARILPGDEAQNTLELGTNSSQLNGDLQMNKDVEVIEPVRQIRCTGLYCKIVGQDGQPIPKHCGSEYCVCVGRKPQVKQCAEPLVFDLRNGMCRSRDLINIHNPC